MGEYFNWVNVDRKEYISPGDFDFGSKRTESSGRDNPVLCALRELLSKEWKGNHIFFMGDEKLIPEDTQNETLQILYNHVAEYNSGDAFDTVYETYKNVSGLFMSAEPEVRKEIEFYIDDLKSGASLMCNEYEIDFKEPFKGLFLRKGRSFRYTINHTKKIYYSFEKAKILYLDHTESDYADPLPLLMGYGRSTDDGAWLGDIIGVADEIPMGYELLERVYLDW